MKRIYFSKILSTYIYIKSFLLIQIFNKLPKTLMKVKLILTKTIILKNIDKNTKKV